MPNLAKEISLTELKDQLYIDTEGCFRRKINTHNNNKDALAGGYDKKGYLTIRINKVRYKAHRLYYMFYYNIENLDSNIIIDHIDGNPRNNLKNNLRIATTKQNVQNRKNNIDDIGISWHIRDKIWTSRIRVDGKLIHLGNYKSKQEAKEIYRLACDVFHESFSKFNNNKESESTMSETYKRLKAEIVVAMKAKDANRLLVLRSLDSSIKNFAITAGHREGPTEDDVISGLSQAVKRGTDSAEQFRTGGREDLVQAELFQVEIAKSFLPEQMSREELEDALRVDVQDYNAINGIATIKEVGKIMKIVVPKYKGKAESKDIHEILKGILG